MKIYAYALLALVAIIETGRYLKWAAIKHYMSSSILKCKTLERKDYAYNLMQKISKLIMFRRIDHFSAVAVVLLTTLVVDRCSGFPANSWAEGVAVLLMYSYARLEIGREALFPWQNYSRDIEVWIRKEKETRWPATVALAKMHLRVKREMLRLFEGCNDPKLLFDMGREIGYWDKHWPKMHVKKITDVNLGFLIGLGIKVLAVDLDNSLLDRRTNKFAPEVVDWIAKAKSKGIMVVIVSNTVTAKKKRRLDRLADSVNVPSVPLCVRFWYWLSDLRLLKPNPYGIQQAATMCPTVSNMNQVAVIGDQAYTDIVAGNTAGAFTILVDPIGGDGLWTRANIFRRYKETCIRGLLSSYYGLL